MPIQDDSQLTHVATLDYEGRHYNVSVKTSFDGVEYVGRLYFADDGWEDAALPDRGALPGRTRDEVLALARRLTSQELILRYRRALAEKRRYLGLRRVTDEVLAKIRYLNQVALSMRAGLLDAEGAAQEIDLTERQLHDLVAKLRMYVGVEGNTGES
jgi:hypothetical protein